MAYQSAKIFSSVVTSTFFRDIQVVGVENIPKDGPLLLYGNHNNQFIDPLLIVAHVPRTVNFIAAAKSMRRPIIGQIGRALGGIPVERPQDLAKPGRGSIIKIENDKMFGLQTQFTTQCKENDIILISGLEIEFHVKKVLSDTELQIQFATEEHPKVSDSRYKIQPKVDQSGMFDSVWVALKNGACIGIFPEGGSHDQTKLLPLKPGICIMALGASQKYNTQVKLQPVGLNYFKGHKFRSKVIIEFGVPYEINQELIDLYTVNKRQAISNLLEIIQSQLKTVTIQANTYSDLSAIMIVRQLYLPDKTRLTPSENLQLVKRFSTGFYKMGNHPEVNQLVTEVKMYNYKLKALGVHDFQVMRMQRNSIKDIYFIAFNLFMAVLSLTFALPGFMMTLPAAIVLNIYTERERMKALANSKVKISGKDVVASYKVLAALVIVPISICIYTAAFYFSIGKWNLVDPSSRTKATIAFLFAWPIYIIAMIRSNDGLVRHSRKVKSQILFYLFASKYNKLQRQRTALQEKIRKLVELFGDDVIQDFKNKRIVHFDQKKDELDINNVFSSLEELGI